MVPGATSPRLTWIGFETDAPGTGLENWGSRAASWVSCTITPRAVVEPRLIICTLNVTFAPTAAAVRCVTRTSSVEAGIGAGRVAAGGTALGMPRGPAEGGAIIVGWFIPGGDVVIGPGSAGVVVTGPGSAGDASAAAGGAPRRPTHGRESVADEEPPAALVGGVEKLHANLARARRGVFLHDFHARPSGRVRRHLNGRRAGGEENRLRAAGQFVAAPSTLPTGRGWSSSRPPW